MALISAIFDSALRSVDQRGQPSAPFTEQTAITELLSDMDDDLKGLEQCRSKALALKQGMM